MGTWEMFRKMRNRSKVVGGMVLFWYDNKAWWVAGR